MRKIILVAAMVLASASAQAGGPRSLSLATADEHTSASLTPAPTTATTLMSEVAPATEAPKYVDRPPAIPAPPPAAVAPPAVTTTISAPAATIKPAAAGPATRTTAKADKPKRKRGWTEGRIISELHRHGIYW
ncbi:hypothetical protein PMI42_08109 [Bradyrhizobium sp. YR681]|uniref:hypothetical protein n=1 Tax=Bradyrhizobium sp. YR681 TaxID=1144344 RepID=UPI00026F7DC9|nr:hypothetical protein [Bradyrhizobium sp. YR681]EJN06990.1 hypothetical protein PMI42_08109 [Bradyrhizobium sp. YR681]